VFLAAFCFSALSSSLVQPTEPGMLALTACLGTVPRIELAPGVLMPAINFGVQNNHSMAINLGARGLDTANVYGDSQQREVGDAVRAAIASGIPRSELFVTTKIECCPGKAFAGDVKGAVLCAVKHDPIKNIQHNYDVLGLDYVDLMLLHWPCDDFEDSVATYKAMEPLVKAGKARAIGISNFNASAIEALMPRVSVRPVINQCGYSVAGHFESTSLWGRDDATQRACDAHNITFSAYSPLGGWAKGGTSHVLNDPTVNAVAQAHNVSAAAVALRWVTQQGIVAVTSSDKESHIAGDLASFDFDLTEDEIERLAKVE
jgi:2,5-diketo-D-gluconate reductase A